MKSLVKILLWLFAIIVIVNIYILLPFFLEWDEKSWRELSVVYSNLWDFYEIWSHYKVNKICNKNKEIGCLNWEVNWLKFINNKEVYLFLNIYVIESTITEPSWNTKIWDYSYKLFMNDITDKYITVKQKSNIPKFWYLNWNKLEFYSDETLSFLNKEKQDIFKKLEENPTIIIDWIDYLK